MQIFEIQQLSWASTGCRVLGMWPFAHVVISPSVQSAVVGKSLRGSITFG